MWHNKRTHLTALAAGPRTNLIVADIQGQCTYSMLRPAHGAQAQLHYTADTVHTKAKGCTQVG